MPKVRYGNGKVKTFPYTRQGRQQAKAFKKRVSKAKSYSGVPSGFKHRWAYRGVWNEKKLKKGKWRISFRATKRRRASRMGTFKVGTTGSWNIKGKQYIRKTGVGSYQTHLVGYKTPNKFKIRK